MRALSLMTWLLEADGLQCSYFYLRLINEVTSATGPQSARQTNTETTTHTHTPKTLQRSLAGRLANDSHSMWHISDCTHTQLPISYSQCHNLLVSACVGTQKSYNILHTPNINIIKNDG